MLLRPKSTPGPAADRPGRIDVLVRQRVLLHRSVMDAALVGKVLPDKRLAYSVPDCQAPERTIRAGAAVVRRPPVIHFNCRLAITEHRLIAIALPMPLMVA
jgi:hypothetical protein